MKFLKIQIKWMESSKLFSKIITTIMKNYKRKTQICNWKKMMKIWIHLTRTCWNSISQLSSINKYLKINSYSLSKLYLISKKVGLYYSSSIYRIHRIYRAVKITRNLIDMDWMSRTHREIKVVQILIRGRKISRLKMIWLFLIWVRLLFSLILSQ
jgi:hypothetical protein